MKNAIIYGVAFLFAFVLVTGSLIYLNSIYTNIFAFDFSPEGSKQTATNENIKADSVATPQQQIAENVVEPQPNADSLKNPISTDSLKNVPAEVKKEEKNNPLVEKVTAVNKSLALNEQQNTAVKPPIIDKKAKSDSIYKDWLKQTSKLYESMDTKKVAKIIEGYSDNIARDLILSMKKKKAAEILSEFKPEVVIRIISVNQ